MLKHTLRSARANVLRQSLAALSVVLGVAFVTGTFILTDGASSAMDTQVTDQLHGTAAGISPLGETPLPADLVDRVRATPGVAAAEGSMISPGDMLAAPGRTDRPATGWVMSIPVSPALSAYTAASGRLPAAPGEAVVDAASADEHGYRLGGPLGVATQNGVVTYTLVGAVDMSRSLYGSRPVVGLTPDDALTAAKADGFRTLLVASNPGTDEAALVAALSGVAGPGAKVLGHDDLVKRTLDDVYRDIDSIRQLLLLFVVVAVLAAGFVIANTFTIVLAQRAREIALLRLVGASRGQVFRGVLAEAALTGTAASAAGLLAGIGVAAGLGGLIGVLGMPVGGDLAVAPRTLLVAFASGILVTVGAALLPAWRGTRVPPVAALSESAVEVARPVGRARITVGVLLLGVAAAALALAGAVPQVAVIGICGFFGLVAVGPVLVPALTRVAGRPLSVLGAWAKLAVSYTSRNRRRVAATTTTLILAVSLVSSVMIGAHSIKAGIEREADAEFGADFAVTATEIPAALLTELGARPELEITAEEREGAAVTMVKLYASEGTDTVRAGELVRDIAAKYPAVSVMDVAAYKETRTGGLDQLLVTVIALLGLAAVIALVGIANTLTLSVAERTREHGVLRAVGVGRRGLRAMLSVEAMLVAFVGAVLGLVLGIAVVIGTLAIAKASDSVRLEIPYAQVGGLLAVVVAAALAASVLPARKAVRGSIVAALADE